MIAPDNPRGIYLHLHGGGWVLGGADMQDPMLERIAENTGQAVDLASNIVWRRNILTRRVRTTSRWATRRRVAGGERQKEFRTDALTIGGRSAGAHLTRW